MKCFFTAVICFIAIHVIAQPKITSFSPVSGPIGATVTITGLGFSTTPANNIVFFGAVKAVVVAATTSTLTVTVPAGATYEPITATVSRLTAYSATPFSVTFSGGGLINTGSFAYNATIDSLPGSETNGLVSADFDNDGKVDAAVVNRLNNTLSVYRNTTAGQNISFAPSINYSTGSNPVDVAYGDMNGDGRMDLIVANQGGNTVSVFENNSTTGTIAFAAKKDFATGTQPSGISVADIDGDGKPDLAIADIDLTGTATILKNTGTAGSISFAAGVDINIAGGPIENVLLQDLNNDLKPELVVTNTALNSVSVLLNTSTGNSISFGVKSNFATGAYPNAIAAGDINKDGKPELVTTDFTSGTVSVLQNTSTGSAITFNAKIALPAGDNLAGITIGDVDGDGAADLVVVNSFDSLVIFKNVSYMGTIIFTQKVTYNSFGSGDVNIADFDGDGLPDIIAAGSLYRAIVYKNRVRAPFIRFFSPTYARIGTTVDIYGSNFAGATAVSFGGVPAASFTVSNSFVINTVVGAGQSGSVSVTTPEGTYALDGFTFTGQPVVQSFSPVLAAQGQTVSITGTDFTGTTAVSFGGVPATSFRVFSDNTIYAVVGVGASGNVAVTTPSGTSALAGFTFIPAPVITSFSPASATSGTEISVTGTNFTGTTAVSFGGKPAAAFTVNSSTSITVIVPDNAPSGSILVTSPGGVASMGGFTYIMHAPAPVISSFSPTSALIGTTVIISGLNFSTNPSDNIVHFGAVKATVTAASTTSLSVTVPLGATYRSISVTTNNLTAYTNYPFSPSFGGSTGGFNSSSLQHAADFDLGFAIPLQTASVDLDEDGKPDVIVLDEALDRLQIYHNKSTIGTVILDSPLRVPTDISSRAFVTADFDGDGKTDIAVLDEFNNNYIYGCSVLFYRNTSVSGLISMALPVKYYFEGTFPSISTGDLNNDGKPDVVVSSSSGSTVGLLKNISVKNVISFETYSNPNASWKLADSIRLKIDGFPRKVILSDVTGDGKTDIVVLSSFANTTSDSICILRNTTVNGSYSFEASKNFACFTDIYGRPYYIFPGDIDGDGKIDLVTPNWNTSSTFSIYRNEGTQGNVAFAPMVEVLGAYKNLSGDIGDLDGDGKPDIAVASGYPPPGISLLKNTSTPGAISFDPKVDFIANLNQAPEFTTLSDMDGDGKLDVIVMGYTSQGSFSVFLNTNGTTLPLKDIKLFGQEVEGQTLLYWQVDQEFNIHHFEVEYSANRTGFEKVGEVASAGNSTGIKNYSFVHPGAVAGTNFYRLKIVNGDGTFVYSPVVLVNIASPSGSIVIYPNPATNSVTITHPVSSKNAQLMITDLYGKKLLNVISKANSVSTNVDVKILPPGLYQVTYIDGDKKMVKSLLVNRN